MDKPLEDFSRSVRQGRNDVLVYIAPDDPEGNYPRFRLLRSV